MCKLSCCSRMFPTVVFYLFWRPAALFVFMFCVNLILDMILHWFYTFLKTAQFNSPFSLPTLYSIYEDFLLFYASLDKLISELVC